LGGNTEKWFAEGVRLFNRQRYFEAHEAWEEVWTPSRDPARRFLQALIHFAVGLHHLESGNAVGAQRQFGKGLAKGEPYRPNWAGVNLELIASEIEGLIEDSSNTRRARIEWSKQKLEKGEGWPILGGPPPQAP
jgi:hypothetical protein